MRHFFTSYVFRSLALAAIVLSPAGLFSQTPSLNETDLSYPQLERPIQLLIPQDLWHLTHTWDTALVKIRIDESGSISEWIPLHLPHFRLEKSLGVALRNASFVPAMEDGQPITVDIVAEIPLRDVVRFSVVSQSLTEHLEARMASLAPQMNELVVRSPGELDKPLAIDSAGEVFKARNEAGNVLTGTVNVEFFVDPNGEPRMIRTIEVVDPSLAQAAIMTTRNMRFTPPRYHQKPAVTKARLPIIVKE